MKYMRFFSAIVIMASLLTIISCSQHKSSFVRCLKPIKGAVKSEQFTASTVKGKSLFIEHYQNINLLQLIGKGTCQVQVNCKVTIKSLSVFPKKYCSKVETAENGFKLNIDQWPVYLVIKVNNMDDLVISANPDNQPLPESSKIVDIMSFGVDTSGTADNTLKIQHALDSISGLTDKVLYFPAGNYLCSILDIKSNSNIYLAEGAVLNSITDTTIYKLKRSNAKINIVHAQNVTIGGYGTIDAGGAERFEKYKIKSGSILYTANLQHFNISGVTLRNSGGWNNIFDSTVNMVMDNVKIITPPNHEWTDGMDIQGGSKNVRILNSFAYCNDDPAAVHSETRSSNFDVDSIIFENYTGYNPRANDIRLGFWLNSVISNVYFKNCYFGYADKSAVIIHPKSMAPFEFYPNTWQNFEGRYKNLVFEGCVFESCERKIAPILDIVGEINGIRFKNCTFDHDGTIKIRGINNTRNIKDFEINNCFINNKLITSLTDFGYVDTAYLENFALIADTKNIPETLKLCVGFPSIEPYDITYNYYEVACTNLPDFAKLKPVKSGTTKTISNAFIFGIRQLPDHYALTFDASIDIPEDGNYWFVVFSDDGSKLLVDGKEIVNNNKVQAFEKKYGSVHLFKGKHQLRLEYFENIGGEGLMIQIFRDIEINPVYENKV